MRLSVLIVGLLCTTYVQAQTVDSTPISGNFKNELGIDFANFIPFIKKNIQSYLVNYKRYVNKKHAIRAGLNMEFSSFDDGRRFFGGRIGYEYGINDGKWRLFFGSDFSSVFTKNNYQSSISYQYGIEPLIGYKYYITSHFSLSTEVKINYYRYYTEDKSSFSLIKTTSNSQVVIGSVGMILLNYQF